MTVDTKTAPRRELDFPTLSDALADAESVAAGPHETTGNWSFGQILEHLARSIDANLDGVEAKPPLPLRLFGPLMYPMMKRMVFGKAMVPGFTLPARFRPQFNPDGDPPLEEALAHYRNAVERANATTELKKHPFFGIMSMEEFNTLHTRHAALHLSFVRPASSA